MRITDARDSDDRFGVEMPTSTVVTDDRGACDLMGHDSRARLAETCGTCDESPSSDLDHRPTGRRHRPRCKRGSTSTAHKTSRETSTHMLGRILGKQGQRHRCPRRSARSEQHLSPRSGHGVPWKHPECQEQAHLFKHQRGFWEQKKCRRCREIDPQQ